MAVQEQYANAASTILNGNAGGGITSGATSLIVLLATDFPPVPQFRILIDGEYMLVTGVAGTTFTVTRGIEGSTATSHINGAAVTHLLTVGSLISAVQLSVADLTALGSAVTTFLNQGTTAFVQSSDSYYAWYPTGSTPPNGVPTVAGSGGVWSLDRTPGKFTNHLTHITTNYDVLTTDEYLMVETISTDIIVTLPTVSSSNPGDAYTVKDAQGLATTHSITINTSDGTNIDGAATVVMNAPYQAMTFILNTTASRWNIL